jgi:hypothetical protein
MKCFIGHTAIPFSPYALSQQTELLSVNGQYLKMTPILQKFQVNAFVELERACDA